MSSPRPAVRVLVLEPREPGLRRLGTVDALRRLGGEARIEVLHDAATLRARVAGSPADLVVVDQAVGAEADAALDALREAGPPVVFVSRDAGEEQALDAFRRGAADCVAAGADYAEILPVAALEQIRRWRALRARGEVEERIQWLERLHETIVETIPTAVAVLDEHGRLVTANPAFARLAGSAAGALRGRPLAEALAQALPAADVASVVAEAGLGELRGPRLLRSREEPGRSFDVRATRIAEGRVLLLISEVTEVEELLRKVGELQRYNENIIQNMNSALVVADPRGRISYANPTAEAILGAGPGELAERSIGDWFPEAGREEGILWRTLRQGVRFRGAETVIARPDGRLVPVGVSCAPVVGAEGVRQGAVAIFQDLSEIKQLQRQVLQTEKMASIGQLAAGVAHEINNPMGFIHANLYQMSEYLEDLGRVWERVGALRKAAEDPGATWERVRGAAAELGAAVEELEAEYLLEDLGKAVRESTEGSERIRHIVQDLRAFSHHDTAERTESDVNRALDSTASIVWTMMKHSVVLTKQYEELPPIPCYPMQLKQVFMNLLVNAYQAIEARAQLDRDAGRPSTRGEIRLRTRLRDGGVSIEVSDNGTGIERSVVDRIFDPFFTTKEVGEGTGLGLSTSYTLVKRHGGSLAVRSRAGEGATFEVWLPLADAEEPA